MEELLDSNDTIIVPDAIYRKAARLIAASLKLVDDDAWYVDDIVDMKMAGLKDSPVCKIELNGKQMKAKIETLKIDISDILSGKNIWDIVSIDGIDYYHDKVNTLDIVVSQSDVALVKSSFDYYRKAGTKESFYRNEVYEEVQMNEVPSLFRTAD